mgnify:CR=1 FL=1
MEGSNQFLGTERIGRLMQKYAIPCIISLLVGALYNIVDRFSLQMRPILAPTAMPLTRLFFR